MNPGVIIEFLEDVAPHMTSIFFFHRALEGALIIHVFNVSHESCHEIMSGINHRYTQLSLSALWKQSSFWAEHFSELSQAQKSLLRRQRPDI